MGLGFGIRENLFQIPDLGIKNGTGSRILNTASQPSYTGSKAGQNACLLTFRILSAIQNDLKATI